MEDDNGITEEAEAPNQNGQGPSAVSSMVRAFPWKLSSRRLDTSKIHGFDGEVTVLMNLLLRVPGHDDGFKAIAIVGGSGIGKTTLCKLIFSKPEIKKQFLPRIFVSIPAAHQPIEIVRSILTLLGLGDEMISSIESDHGLSGLVYTTYLQLVGKRYLIVLDDSDSISTPNPWFEELKSSITADEELSDKLAYGFPKGHGGTVIVASRNEEMAKKMVGGENIHELHPRSDSESCWLIFKDTVEEVRKPFNPTNGDALKKEITRKCGGVPSAAKIIGKIMREQLEQ
ncbi:probable disease resistance protein At4g19060 [Carica papaya]|uniref:probable disease resistance protein At4g19060 n=1 Tax=Carica papaya TaxID=3649 RepID=UPI000B8D05CC|nr:probable disease resistance protein At4g19060 [Carica papaya]